MSLVLAFSLPASGGPTSRYNYSPLSVWLWTSVLSISFKNKDLSNIFIGAEVEAICVIVITHG